MKVTWLGQAGLLFETEQGCVMVDPYLSDSCHRKNPKSYRRTPVDGRFFEKTPDVLILTHNHQDHADPETLPRILGAEKPITVLASEQGWQEVVKYRGGHNYVMFRNGTVWTQCGIRFRAVHAEHSEPTAIGVILDDGEKTYYVTGDTLFSEKVIESLPVQPDVVFLPVNGVGCNMNMTDAAEFARRIGAKQAVPIHWGMFDDLTPDGFRFDGRCIPTVYQEIPL